ncbi:MAG TPA: hypothetical protein VMZ06_00580 [Candidatus Bathyarchaeia archaeon]|nr:hypothetical protein [Candidatus Bathyarchaeia archaeon]
MTALCLALLVVASAANYQFDGSISRDVLDNFLSRAITMNGMSFSPCFDDDLRMLDHIGAKFIGRVAYLWGQPPGDEAAYWQQVRQAAQHIRQPDPDRIVQACVFEAVFDGVNGIKAPGWVFEEFGLAPEQRTFSYDAMLFEDGRYRDLWGPGGSVPDITRLETKLWFYYRARNYIDAGYEAIHFGQLGLIGANDPGLAHWKDLLDRVRAYGAARARRHYVLFDAHVVVQNIMPAVDGRMLLDFLSFPLRPKEVPTDPQKAILDIGHADTIYGRSPGGLHPSGWPCDHMPYLVEFDQCHASGHEGQGGLGPPFVWGFEEAAWLAKQPAQYRDEWLAYTHDWLRKNDPNGHLQMPGSVPTAVKLNASRWYRANTPSAACPDGYGQEDAIKAIWETRKGATP